MIWLYLSSLVSAHNSYTSCIVASRIGTSPTVSAFESLHPAHAIICNTCMIPVRIRFADICKSVDRPSSPNRLHPRNTICLVKRGEPYSDESAHAAASKSSAHCICTCISKPQLHVVHRARAPDLWPLLVGVTPLHCSISANASAAASLLNLIHI